MGLNDSPTVFPASQPCYRLLAPDHKKEHVNSVTETTNSTKLHEQFGTSVSGPCERAVQRAASAGGINAPARAQSSAAPNSARMLATCGCRRHRLRNPLPQNKSYQLAVYSAAFSRLDLHRGVQSSLTLEAVLSPATAASRQSDMPQLSACQPSRSGG